MIGFFSRACVHHPEIWKAYTTHPFVQQLGAGTLPLRAFRHYMVQDFLFLKQFIRAFALGIYKAETTEDMHFFTSGLTAILHTELTLHTDYAATWGISLHALETTPAATATLAYTRYVLDVGITQDLLALCVALAPCMLGYGEIAQRLAAQSPPDNPYQHWISTYSGEAYQTNVRATQSFLGNLEGRLYTPMRESGLMEIFTTATQLETAFWQQSLDAHSEG